MKKVRVCGGAGGQVSAPRSFVWQWGDRISKSEIQIVAGEKVSARKRILKT